MLTALTERELEIVRKGMAATLDLLSTDFEARMGLSEDEMHSLLEKWPDIDDSDDHGPACLAVNNSLNDLLHGIGIGDEQAVSLTGANTEEIYRIYRKWAFARGWRSTGVR